MAEGSAFLSEPRPGRTFFLGLSYTSDQAMNSNLEKLDAALGELFVQAGGSPPEVKAPEEPPVEEPPPAEPTPEPQPQVP